MNLTTHNMTIATRMMKKIYEERDQPAEKKISQFLEKFWK
jgi:hypothetical protein